MNEASSSAALLAAAACLPPGAAADRNEARRRYAEILAVQEDDLGALHPDTLLTKFNLAAELMRAGEAPAARALFAEALRESRAVLAAVHSRIAERPGAG